MEEGGRRGMGMEARKKKRKEGKGRERRGREEGREEEGRKRQGRERGRKGGRMLFVKALLHKGTGSLTGSCIYGMLRDHNRACLFYRGSYCHGCMCDCTCLEFYDLEGTGSDSLRGHR